MVSLRIPLLPPNFLSNLPRNDLAPLRFLFPYLSVIGIRLPIRGVR